jgi:hypothetical protein
MKCFYSESEAVGICKSCGRGLSRAYATEFPKGLACAKRCEADVQRLIRVEEAVPGGAGINGVVSGGFTMLAGGAFVYFSGGLAGGLSLPSFMGVVFFFYGLYVAVRAIVVAKRRKSRAP